MGCLLQDRYYPQKALGVGFIALVTLLIYISNKRKPTVDPWKTHATSLMFLMPSIAWAVPVLFNIKALLHVERIDFFLKKLINLSQISF